MWSVFFVLLSYLDREVVRADLLNSSAGEADKENKVSFSLINGTLCARSSTVEGNSLHQVSDGTELVRTVLTPQGALLSCAVTSDHVVVKSFMQECRLGLLDQRSALGVKARPVHVDEARRMCLERSGSSRDASLGEERTERRRSKRGFTYPGTLWCGAGNMADTYNQLGDFADTDSCCRTHDHCQHVIHPFSSKFGLTNFKFLSISHCDCDEALKACLRKVNDTSSRVVGQAFFNVLTVPCFDFAYEEQCVERHWYGLCKGYQKVPVAVLREAVPYDFGGIQIIDVLTVAPPKKPSDEEKPESSTQSPVSEPSLRNVMTAAEDFIKVLATVSTSQGSPSESEKEQTESSEKKKEKKANKKKKKKNNKKHRGKGRRRQQQVGVKAEEGAAATLTGGKAEEVLSLSNFISETHKPEQGETNGNRVSEHELRDNEKPFDEVMLDELGEGRRPATVPPPVLNRKSNPEEAKGVPSASHQVLKVRSRDQARGRKMKKQQLAEVQSDTVSVAPTSGSASIEPQVQQSSTAEAVRDWRGRTEEGVELEVSERQIKVSSPAERHTAPAELLTLKKTSLLTLERHRPPARVLPRGDVWAPGLRFGSPMLRRTKAKERSLRNRRRNAVQPATNENSQPKVANATIDLNPPTISTPTTTTEMQSRWREVTTASPAGYSDPQQKTEKPQEGSEETPALRQIEAAPHSFTARRYRFGSAALALSPQQLIMERARAQFSRKRRRKAWQLRRQQ